MSANHEAVPPPPMPPRVLWWGWFLWRLSAVLFLLAAARIIWNLGEIRARLTEELRTDPNWAFREIGEVERTASFAPLGVIVAGVVLLLVMLVCVALMRHVGSRGARVAAILFGAVLVFVTELAVALGGTADDATPSLVDALPDLQAAVMLVAAVLVFLRPSAEWLYLAHEHWLDQR
ncbi:hypothetical protein HT102_12080 [Hoyosella sp. G463]|uniref:Uncharacterized protein n=1 Tax=Lolliginicoccus lacisalsi TaxID=2742202 RepID=A0A927JDP1_9ACTN|nr:hypothetical protein [Lolliginicoccus lacisalsi]MBD8507223.1 hypothetical protein [Lolliginicoccus lacisalsi]